MTQLLVVSGATSSTRLSMAARSFWARAAAVGSGLSCSLLSSSSRNIPRSVSSVATRPSDLRSPSSSPASSSSRGKGAAEPDVPPCDALLVAARVARRLMSRHTIINATPPIPPVKAVPLMTPRDVRTEITIGANSTSLPPILGREVSAGGGSGCCVRGGRDSSGGPVGITSGAIFGGASGDGTVGECSVFGGGSAGDGRGSDLGGFRPSCSSSQSGPR